MELRHLKMIQEVASTKSLTRAAENLYLTQSALSHQLKEVEAFFNVQLFIRQKKQMLLTREGELVLQSGQRILEELENTVKLIQQMTDKDRGEIRMSTECYTSYPWLSGFLKEFRLLYPKVDVQIKSEATLHALMHVLENKIDVGIFDDNKSNKIVYTPLFSDELYAIVPPGHQWANKRWVELDAFLLQPYIMYNIPLEESTMYNIIFQKVKPVKLYQVMLTEAILEMVKAGLGITIQPQWIASRYIKSGELIPVRITRKGWKRTWYAGVLKNKALPDYIQSFINYLAAYMKQLDKNDMLIVQGKKRNKEYNYLDTLKLPKPTVSRKRVKNLISGS